ncbi:MAG: hypothetical protein LBM75_11325 [Myxococcales bacterium]|nr:hypothetical protein [Myxococcales bacterium]
MKFLKKIESVPILCAIGVIYWLLASGGVISAFFGYKQLVVISVLFISVSVILFFIPTIELFTERFLLILVGIGWLMAILGVIATLISRDSRFFIVSAFVFVSSCILWSIPPLLSIVALLIITAIKNVTSKRE